MIGYFICLIHLFILNAFQQGLDKLGTQFHFSSVVGDWLHNWSYGFLIHKEFLQRLENQENSFFFRLRLVIGYLIGLIFFFIHIRKSNKA